MVGRNRDILSWIESRLALVAMVGQAIIIVGSGVVSALLADAAGWMAEYKPFSYYVAGLFGALATMLILLVVAKVIQLSMDISFRARLKPKGAGINPRKRTFESERIFLSDLANPVAPIISRL